MITVLDLAEQDTNLHRESVREQAGPCPDPNCRCQRDGFRVKWNDDKRKWVFMCRGCWDSGEYLPDKERKRGWGDEIDYLRHYRGMKYRQAKDFLAEQGNDVDTDNARRAPVLGMNYTSEHWQDQTHAAMQDHIARLWDEDTTALDYARSRGFSDERIKQFQFGYSLQKDIPRLLIPSINDKQYVAVQRRDLRSGIPSDERWKDAPGSTKSELYLADCLKRKRPTILCEDAFSALSVVQEAGDVVNAVATCGADCCQEPKWLARLAVQPIVLVALDADGVGDENSKWWLDRLPNARRLRPLLKDINDMLMGGWDIREWIQTELQESQPDEPLRCTTCHIRAEDADDFYYDENGNPFCNLHYAETGEQITAEASGPEQLKRIAEQLATAWPGGCTVSEPMHCTPEEYIARRKQEMDEEAQRRREEQQPTQEAYWARTRRALAKSGYYEQVARDHERLRERIQQTSETLIGRKETESHAIHCTA